MLGSLIGKYKILRLIGEGGMATVYEAEHEMLGTKVAIKVLNPILSANTQIKERFRNEAKLMASLDHPNITKVIDFNEQPHQLSIIMEYLNGEDLNDKIKRNGALSEKDTVEVFSQTLSAFQYAHEKGIVHRDIKPSNIFILQDGRVKILDFGIAKLFGQGNEMTQTGTQMGTPIYMSPEQVKADKSIDHRSDIYSLGVTMYFAINGKPPYNSNTDSQFDIFSKIVYEPLPNLSADSIFNHSIVKACQKDREKRFQSCQEWLQSIKSVDATQTSFNSVENLKDKTKETIVDKSFNDSRSVKSKNTHKPTDQEPSSKKNKLIFIGIVAILISVIGYFSFSYYKNERLKDAINNFNNKEYEKAYNIFNSSILQENAEAQYYLGNMYLHGKYVKTDYDKAFTLAKASAEQGNDKGLNLVGVIYKNGLGTEKDINMAIEYFTKSTQISTRNNTFAGNAKAYTNLGDIYSEGGGGIERDYNKAIEYYTNAIYAANGQVDRDLSGRPEWQIGAIYMKGGYGVQVDYNNAKDYFLKAIEKNNSDAAVYLGWMYENGKGVPQDNVMAFNYYTISSNLNNNKGQTFLGSCYLGGKGCTQDDIKALELFKKSAAQGNDSGLANLGFMYEFNRGGAGYDIHKARMYYKQAADLGNEWAKKKLGNRNVY